MPLNINGEIYTLEKIEQLTKQKIVIAKKVEILMKKLIQDHINDEKMEQKEIKTVENISDMVHKIPKGESIATVNKHINGELNFMSRDIQELNKELQLVNEIHNLLTNLVKITNVEEAYFKHHHYL